MNFKDLSDPLFSFLKCCMVTIIGDFNFHYIEYHKDQILPVTTLTLKTITKLTFVNYKLNNL